MQTTKELQVDHVVPWTEFENFIDRRLREDPTIALRGPFRPESRLHAPTTLIGQDTTTAWEMTLRSRWPNARFDRGPTIADECGSEISIELFKAAAQRVCLAILTSRRARHGDNSAPRESTAHESA